MKTKILVCCHKKDFMATQYPYMPIHVGKALHSDLELGIPGDDTGDNISVKNGSYCELTGIYWAWKNLKDVDIVGLCHYRRYFDLSSAKSKNREPYIRHEYRSAVDSKVIDKLFVDYDIVIPGYSYIYESLMDEYAMAHSLSDIKVVEQTIKALTPEYTDAFNHVMKERNYYCGCNMLICKKQLFDDYCKWLFTILFEVEKKTDISNYDNYQKRIYGFISERLLNVYIYKHKLSVCHRPIISLMEGTTPSRIKQLMHKFKAYLCFSLKKS